MVLLYSVWMTDLKQTKAGIVATSRGPMRLLAVLCHFLFLRGFVCFSYWNSFALKFEFAQCAPPALSKRDLKVRTPQYFSILSFLVGTSIMACLRKSNLNDDEEPSKDFLPGSNTPDLSYGAVVEAMQSLQQRLRSCERMAFKYKVFAKKLSGLLDICREERDSARREISRLNACLSLALQRARLPTYQESQRHTLLLAIEE